MTKNYLKYAAPAFTLLEMLIAVVMVGVIAAFTIPNFLITVSKDTLNNQVKSQMQQIQLAVIRYKQDNSTATTVDSDDIAALMKYVSKKTAGTLITGGVACAALRPCYLFSDNSVVQVATAASGDNFLYFNIDPDGSGVAKPVTIMYDYTKNRITTRQNAGTGLLSNPTISPPTGLTVFTTNPSYYK